MLLLPTFSPPHYACLFRHQVSLYSIWIRLFPPQNPSRRCLTASFPVVRLNVVTVPLRPTSPSLCCCLSGVVQWQPEREGEGELKQQHRKMSNSGYNEFFNYMPQLVQEDGSSDEDEGLITVELRMPLLTDECEDKVQQKLKAVEGVSTVHIDVTRQKVTVKGTAEPATILAKAKKAMPHTEFW